MIIVINEEIDMALTDFSTYESYRAWMLHLRKKGGGTASPDTVRNYNRGLSAYCAYTGKTPDEIISDVEKDLRELGSYKRHNSMLDQFWDSTEPKSTAGMYFGAVKSFYRANGHRLTTESPAQDTVRDDGKYIVSNSEIRAICEAAPIQHSSWILANSYLSLRINAIYYLQAQCLHPETWTEDKPLYPVHVPKQLTGTFDVDVYIGHDAAMLLKTYFKANNFTGSDRPWGFVKDADYLNQCLKRYAYRAGVVDAPKGLWPDGTPKGFCKIHSHIFRRRKQTIMEKPQFRINSNWIDHCLGHIPRGADAAHYSAPPQEDIYQCHMITLPEFEIFGHHPSSPTAPNVELKKMLYLQQIRELPGMTPEKLRPIENSLKMFRRIDEVEQAVAQMLTK